MSDRRPSHRSRSRDRRRSPDRRGDGAPTGAKAEARTGVVVAAPPAPSGRAAASAVPAAIVAAVNEYGKYGILRETDFHAKAVSFQAWLRDVKKIPDFNGPKYEAMDHFRDYMEDYNTATLPHAKYYDIEKYEQRKLAKEQAKRAKRHKPRPAEEEATAYAERMRQRAEANKKEFALILQTMDRSKIESMREQQRLRDQMQMHYKAGNMDEARRLEHLLTKKDEAKPEPEFKPDTGRHF
ncbi:hypothetical protein SPRG_21780 [Saprolegnia parasitica CBS 223.65]|uniref:Uncharacterized protein n=1 Tax=Saprolegnia parasitica (strain CBS 223.65) TaxID=695850 RepID=A0A067BIG6_SAPPC|nr:hypothetical protein SPRG_21780 [Saprolegnia parasitica CBS 223.65]KDO17973.1 hypothetical protein SPRG_21780 [Saprolegnia parasitica CBS 223.65]|eukprot:XP_012211318.1 hypothetical protein SPRG_21780 [Saprolegnia parasitica CBS 223.65]